MYLGVDGGGTKTAFCLLDADGQLRAETMQVSLSYLSEGTGLVERVLRIGIEEICESAGITPQQIHRSFIGIPCYGEISDHVAELDAIPGRILASDDYTCDNDMVCGWAASLGGGDGINVVAGTGSIAYGQKDEKTWRGGGWSELFGDEGSGYWIAVQGLNAFSRMSDGRLPIGPLHALFREAMGLRADLDAIDVVLNRWRGDRTRIAALSRVVSQAQAAGDAEADRILQAAGAELAQLVDVGAQALGYPATASVPVSCSGGIFSSAPVHAAFLENLARSHRTYSFTEPLLAPHVGAAVLAARQAGRPFSPQQIQALRASTRSNEGTSS